jgi:hypothetical protein
MPAQYAPLPNPRADPDPENEMNEAFESDEPDPGEEARSLPEQPADERRGGVSSVTAGAYDFEREYDMPPPGSPPSPSAVALPNDYGNSNGFIPTEPVSVPTTSRPSLFRRVMGAILPTHYTPLPTGETSHTGARGSGIENDGVFANVQAKPSVPKTIRTDDGEIYTIPEEVQKEPPPVRYSWWWSHELCWHFVSKTYADAQADAVPSYWETTIHAPLSGLESGSDMIINDLPSGSFVIFSANLLISYIFNFFGFVVTYLFHTSHAAKLGSRAGFGLTLIQYGYYSRSFESSPSGVDWATEPPPPTSLPTADPFSDGDIPLQSDKPSMTLKDASAIVLMTLGMSVCFFDYVLCEFWRYGIRVVPFHSIVHQFLAGQALGTIYPRDITLTGENDLRPNRKGDLDETPYRTIFWPRDPGRGWYWCRPDRRRPVRGRSRHCHPGWNYFTWDKVAEKLDGGRFALIVLGTASMTLLLFNIKDDVNVLFFLLFCKVKRVSSFFPM